MDRSTNLSLPYLAAAQAQKHVTHNEALRALDAIVQVGVLSRALSVPPGSPDEGDRYLVGDSPTGDWTDHADELAAYQDGAWAFYVPLAGWLAWIVDEDALVAWDGTGWTVAGAGSLNPADMIGINATADATNRLAVKSDATLFSHDDVTPGSGDHQMKINKSSESDTASMLFQTGFSGRAEFGLAGDDDWHVKVSPDGSAWFEALVADRATGRISFPNTTTREVLAGARMYYVNAATGDDANDGLSVGAAFETLQKALDGCATIDFNGYTVTIQLADGTYSAGGSVPVTVGQATVAGLVIQGNSSAPANVVINPGNNYAVQVLAGARVTVKDLTITNARFGLYANRGGAVEFSNLIFGAAYTSGVHLYAGYGGTIFSTGSYAITGGALAHIQIRNNGIISTETITVTLSGTPAWSYTFASVQQATLNCAAVTYSGSATGKRYDCFANGLIQTNGAGTASSYFPGSTNGTTSTGGLQL